MVPESFGSKEGGGKWGTVHTVCVAPLAPEISAASQPHPRPGVTLLLQLFLWDLGPGRIGF